MESKKEINEREAPTGFYAVLKSEVKQENKNICSFCDARKLCQENENYWCLKNRCMSYEIRALKNGKTYKRQDECSVVFKKTRNE